MSEYPLRHRTVANGPADNATGTAISSSAAVQRGSTPRASDHSNNNKNKNGAEKLRGRRNDFAKRRSTGRSKAGIGVILLLFGFVTLLRVLIGFHPHSGQDNYHGSKKAYVRIKAKQEPRWQSPAWSNERI
jgi:hypothetical protein